MASGYAPASQNYPTPGYSTAAPVAESAPAYSTATQAPPSPAEITEFGEEVTDASELFEEAEDDLNGGLLMEYLKQDG